MRYKQALNSGGEKKESETCSILKPNKHPLVIYSSMGSWSMIEGIYARKISRKQKNQHQQPKPTSQY